MNILNSGPTDDLRSRYLLSVIHLRNVAEYAALGADLPTTEDDYKLDLSLEDSAVQKYKDDIAAILVVYRNIREHCTTYKLRIHPETVALSHAVKTYCSRVLMAHPVLYERVADLEAAVKRRAELSEIDRIRQDINQLILKDIELLKEDHNLAIQVSNRLSQFEEHACDSNKALERRMKALDMKLMNDAVDGSKLREAIKVLTRLSDAAKQNAPDDTKRTLIPLIGYIPETILRTDGKDAAKLIKDAVSGKHGQTAASVIQVQGELMSENLGKTAQLLSHAKTAIQLLQAFFHSMQLDLRSAINTAREPYESIRVRFDVLKAKWQELYDQTDHYIQIAYVVHGADLDSLLKS